LNEGKRYSINHRIILPDGETRVIHEDAELIKDETGNPVAMIGTSQDITDRIHAERTIRESESRYRSLFEYSPISIWEEDFSKVKEFFDELSAKGVVNFRDYFDNHPEDVERCVDLVTILDANTASMELHQARDKNDLRGSLTKIFERDGLGIFKEELIALAEGRTFFRSTDVRLTVKEETYAFIFQLTVPPRHQQSLSKVYLSIIDVTERMIAEKALQTARDSALFYLDLLGHDITNQLQVIIGGTALLQDHCDDQSIAERLDDILLAGNKCAQVISKVKTTQDIMSVSLEIRLLDHVLSDCITTFSSQHDDTHIAYESEVKDAFVQVDKYLDVLFCSILENAIMHNPEKKKNVWIELVEANGGFRVSISDDGIGISDSRKVALFERSHRFGGVGLHLAKQIVDKYGGSIQVNDRIEGDVESGVKFCIWFPKRERKE
ncbi:MAG: PAS domain-containing sensor histidine kinase, partial [Candidatus Thorarchaeota archaeon]